MSADGRLDSEISCRISLASGDFWNLSRSWAHAGLPRKRKLELFNALVLSKWQHGFSTLWLVTAQRQRFDRFHVRCVRKVLGIRGAFVSRTSNREAFARGDTRPVLELVLQCESRLFGKIVLSPGDSPVSQSGLPVGTINWTRPRHC